MKKLLTILFTLAATYLLKSQTIVSTSPENKNVVLEEFTGIHCQYCPDGHAIAKAIQDADPDNVVLINIHTGGFADPGAGESDFRTSFGAAIAGQSGLTGYPSGTVNRHVFSGYSMTAGGTAQSRNSWQTTTNTILSQSSYVNIAVEAFIDYQTRELTTHVEAYYTGNSPVGTNKLNVVLLQNNTKGIQSGGNVGSEYIHMHRLVDMITGQWGEDINTTTTGTFIDKTYNYTIPQDYNGIDVPLGDLEVAVFIAEGQQEIITGSRVYPTITNLLYTENASIEEFTIPEKVCGNTFQPAIKIKNLGSNVITKFNISYNINNGTNAEYAWNGTLNSLNEVEITLDAYNFTPQETNTVKVAISSVNEKTDDEANDNSAEDSFGLSIETNPKITLNLKADKYGSEIKWKLYNSAGNLLKSGGPYGENATITADFDLEADCHLFQIIDSYGDGGAEYSLKDSEGRVIHSSDGQYGNGEKVPFSSILTAPLSVNSVDKVTEFSVFPNPAKGEINIHFGLEKSEQITLNIFDQTGKQINSVDYGLFHPGNIEMKYNSSSLLPGIYHFEITGNNFNKKQKVLVVK